MPLSIIQLKYSV